MSFQNLNLKFSYRSHEDNILKDFYLPVLNNAKKYDRAVGYFSNKLLNYLGKSIYPFIENSGKMRLVFGISLSNKDIEEIKQGYQIREKINNKIMNETKEITEGYLSSSLSNICWMIANEFLDIKIAFQKQKSKGIYHEKISIFQDEKFNEIAINGSINETDSAMSINFEYFDVYKSWEASSADMQRIQEKKDYFEKLWKNETNSLDVKDFPKAAKKRMIEVAPDNPIDNTNGSYEIDYHDFETKESNDLNKIIPRQYQQKAINSWFDNDCKGILEMATGTGKTYTSLLAIKSYLSDMYKKNNVIIICCPYIHLIKQWEDSIYDIFGEDIKTIKCFDSKRKWIGPLNNALLDLIHSKEDFIFVLTTTSTGSKDIFIKTMNSIKLNNIVICDEVHNVGATKAQRFMNIKSQAKMGLSATPIRQYDEEGNKSIKEYFGESIYEFGLAKAIERGFLSKYNYWINFCYLNEEEYERYNNISKKISILYSQSKDNSLSQNKEKKLLHLLIKRSKILASCESKLSKLDKILNYMSDYSNLIVYTAEIPEFFNKTLELLIENDVVCLKIVADVSSEKRTEIINKFSNEDIDCLLAMRCLDEGVDIPNANKAIILSSSTNYKQYIQRRGRVLRKSQNHSNEQIANIYDFLVLPLEFKYNTDRSLFERELKRILEFASLAENKIEIINKLYDFSNSNNLLKQFTNIISEVL